jgi:LacI family transcriptional regulator
MAGIKHVAARAGVSVGTVSNVLNRPDRVGTATRARVEQAIRDLGFVRNAAASTLRAGRSTTLGLLVLDIGNPFFTDVVRGVEAAAAARGYTVLLCNADGSADRQRAHLRFLEEQGVDGVLITPVDDDTSALDRLRAKGTAVVLVDEPGHGEICSVAVDDFRGGQLAGEHLLAQGRTRIAYVTGPPSIRQSAERGRGLVRAVGRRAVRPVVLSALTGAEGWAAVDLVLSEEVDSVFCANDVLALGLLGGLLERGISVPDDLALIGYDDIAFAATAAVPLTSVQQPAQQIGRTAAELLLDELTAPKKHTHQDVVFQPTLVQRRSTGA